MKILILAFSLFIFSAGIKAHESNDVNRFNHYILHNVLFNIRLNSKNGKSNDINMKFQISFGDKSNFWLTKKANKNRFLQSDVRFENRFMGNSNKDIALILERNKLYIQTHNALKFKTL